MFFPVHRSVLGKVCRGRERDAVRELPDLLVGILHVAAAGEHKTKGPVIESWFTLELMVERLTALSNMDHVDYCT